MHHALATATEPNQPVLTFFQLSALSSLNVCVCDLVNVNVCCFIRLFLPVFFFVQSAQLDEFIYHETLVHPAMLAHPDPKRVSNPDTSGTSAFLFFPLTGSVVSVYSPTSMLLQTGECVPV